MASKKFFNVKGKKATVNVLLMEPQVKEVVVDEFIIPILPALPPKEKREKSNFYIGGFLGKLRANLDATDAGSVEINIYCNCDNGNLFYLLPVLNGIVEGIHEAEAYLTLSINLHTPDEAEENGWHKTPLAGVYTQKVVDDLTALMLEC